jgi:hypothetical protein
MFPADQNVAASSVVLNKVCNASFILLGTAVVDSKVELVCQRQNSQVRAVTRAILLLSDMSQCINNFIIIFFFMTYQPYIPQQ